MTPANIYGIFNIYCQLGDYYPVLSGMHLANFSMEYIEILVTGYE